MRVLIILIIFTFVDLFVEWTASFHLKHLDESRSTDVIQFFCWF